MRPASDSGARPPETYGTEVQRLELFPDTSETVCRYIDWATTAGVERGLIGPREVARFWARHVANCAACAPAFTPSAEVADVGSGAGLPGIVLALTRPDLKITLIEPLLRRSVFLGEVTEDLGLSRVRVVRARAEDLAGRERFDVVTARAVAPLDRLARWCLPLVSPGGSVVALKGARARAELAEHEQALRALGASAVRIEEYTIGDGPTVSTVVRIESPPEASTER